MTVLAGACGWIAAAVLLVGCLRLRRRLELVARAEHELRGPTTAIGFAAAALRREPGGLRRALAFEGEVERMRAGLTDLESARRGRRGGASPRTLALERMARASAAGWRPAAHRAGRRLRFRWEAGAAPVRVDSGRLAQALGNLLSNAVEHGSGPVEVRGRQTSRGVVVEVRDAGPAVGLEQPSGGGREQGGPRGPRGWRLPERGGSRTNRGRGLAIAAQAVEEAGGRLAVERREDGTVAAIELPLADR